MVVPNIRGCTGQAPPPTKMLSDLAWQQLKVEKLVWIHAQIFSFAITVDVALRHPDASVLQESTFLLIVRSLGQLIYDDIIQNRRRHTLDLILHINTTIYHSCLFRKHNDWLRPLSFQSRVSTVSSCLRFPHQTSWCVVCVQVCEHMRTHGDPGQRWLFFFRCHLTDILRQGFSWDLGLNNSARLLGERAPGILLFMLVQG